jgi:hypothetical protein
MIGSDGKIYALDLDSAEVSGVGAITGDTFDYMVTGLEADPVSNTLYAINQSATDSNVLAAIDYTTAESTLVEPDYGEDEILNALDRAEDGTYFLGHLPHDGPAGAHLSTLAVDSGNYSTIDTTDLAGGGSNKIVSALVSVADSLYGFVLGGDDGLYLVDTDTGELAATQAASDEMDGITIVAADHTADDTVYVLGRDIDSNVSLYTNDLAGTSTLVGAITGLPTGVSVGNFAIATLLADERVGEDTEEGSGGDSGDDEPGGSGGGDREPEDSDGVDTIVSTPLPPATLPPGQPELAPTGPVTAIASGSTLLGLGLGTGVGALLGFGLTVGLTGGATGRLRGAIGPRKRQRGGQRGGQRDRQRSQQRDLRFRSAARAQSERPSGGSRGRTIL